MKYGKMTARDLDYDEPAEQDFDALESLLEGRREPEYREDMLEWFQIMVVPTDYGFTPRTETDEAYGVARGELKRLFDRGQGDDGWHGPLTARPELRESAFELLVMSQAQGYPAPNGVCLTHGGPQFQWNMGKECIVAQILKPDWADCVVTRPNLRAEMVYVGIPHGILPKWEGAEAAPKTSAEGGE